jgi:toxin ParE1/3/4
MNEECKVFWTGTALADLKSISDFMDLFSPQISIKTIKKLILKAKTLELDSKGGNLLDRVSFDGKPYRFVLEGNYKIVYSIKAKTVWIHTIFDSRQVPRKLTMQ